MHAIYDFIISNPILTFAVVALLFVILIYLVARQVLNLSFALILMLLILAGLGIIFQDAVISYWNGTVPESIKIEEQKAQEQNGLKTLPNVQEPPKPAKQEPILRGQAERQKSRIEEFGGSESN